MIYPVSEIFTSPQGEGAFCGAAMTFIRLAGCSVGRPFPKERYESSKVVLKPRAVGMSTELAATMIAPGLPIYTEMCTLSDGRTMECDTDYRVKERLTSEQILERVPAEIPCICITGGEPFIHNLAPLVCAAVNGKSPITWQSYVHIETSGTRTLEQAFQGVGLEDGVTPFWLHDIWISVSPKLGVLPEMIERADEIKLLVDDDFDVDKLPHEVFEHPLVFLQPVNKEFEINMDNVRRCLEWQRKFPEWRISSQAHKLWGVR